MRTLSAFAMKLASHWQNVPYPCGKCGRVIDPTSHAPNERAAWCKHCNEVAHLPCLKTKDWVAGVVLLLAVKVNFGI
ncbi:MAG: hypothetical protein KDB14_32120 [Planctomycetales bacterium]|nr:hypothetical protein [Planctomycetales bacterium]